MSRVLYVRIDDDLHSEIAAIARETGHTISQVVTHLLGRSLGRPNSIEAAISRRSTEPPR